MAPQAIALIVAEPADADRGSLEAACAEAGFSSYFEPSAEIATSKLGGRRYDALVLDMRTPGAALLCMRARGKLLRNRIPVLAFVDGEDEAGFARAYRAGADEVLVSGHPERLSARLRSLTEASAPEPPEPRGDAVVADGDRARGEVLERVLRDAGFRVELAMDAFAARLQVGRPALKVAVVDAALEDVPSLVAQARAKGARCAWVVRARPEQLDEARQKLARVERATVVNAYGAPDDVLFETNRLLETRATEGRADTRRLRGSIVRFGAIGSGKKDVGYTYNISSAGLYVRTLAPPDVEAIEIEIVPPDRTESIALRGDVVWRREFGTTRREPVPAGFGVRLTGGDLAAWTSACPPMPVVVQSLAPAPEPKPFVTHPTPVPKPASTLRRSAPSPDRPRLPGKLRSPSERPSVDGTRRDTSFPRIESTRAAALPSGMKLELRGVPEKRAPELPQRPREPQSSVEEIIASVLGTSAPSEDALGATPLSIDGDAVVELAESAALPEEGPVEESADPSKTAHPSDRPTVEVEALKKESRSEFPDLELADIPSIEPPDPDEDRPAKGDEPRRASLEDLDQAAASLTAARAPFLSEPGPIEVPEVPVRVETESSSTARAPSVAAAPPSTTVGSTAGVDPWARTMHLNAVKPEAVQAAAADTERPPDPAASAGAGPVRARSPEARREPAPETVRRPRSSGPPRRDSGGELTVPTSGVSASVWFALVAMLVVGGALVVFRYRSAAREASSAARPPAENLAPSSATAPPEAPATESPPSRTGGETASARAPEAVSATAKAPAPAATPSTRAAAEVPAPDEAALAKLDRGSGFLLVRSPLSTNVYVYGNLAGRTNERFVTKCGPRFIRLGTTPGAWQGEGFVQIVKCGGSTEIDAPK